MNGSFTPACWQAGIAGTELSLQTREQPESSRPCVSRSALHRGDYCLLLPGGGVPTDGAAPE